MPNPSARIHQFRSFLDVIPRLTDTIGIVGSLLLLGARSSQSGREDLWLAAVMAVIVFYSGGRSDGPVSQLAWRFRRARGRMRRAHLVTHRSDFGWRSDSRRASLAPGTNRFRAAICCAGFCWRRRRFRPGGLLIARRCGELRKHGWNTRGFAIVGANELGFQLARNIEGSPQMGLKLVGFFDDRPPERRAAIPGDVGTCIGNLDDLLAQARDGRVHMIYITLPLRAEQRIKSVLARLADTTASVYVVPDFFVFELLHSRWTNIGGLPAVSIFETPLYGVGGAIKRVIDVVLASLFLIFAAVPMLAIAAAIKLTSRGPVFFKQKRYGLDGRPIDVWKFRSMKVCENGPAVAQATKSDPRITPLGAFLRRSSLDELPQLFNVLEGNMSLVGPRPHANVHNEQYRKQIQGYMLRHKVKPGITGLAQVSGWRGETDTLDKMQKRVECDHQYIRDWSPWLDMKILVRTIAAVLARQNAY